MNGILAALAECDLGMRGTIVQVGSALAYRAIPLQASYCRSKFGSTARLGPAQGIRRLPEDRSEALSTLCAVSLLHALSGVRVTTVHMPALNTPQFGWVRSRLPFHPQPVPRHISAELAAEAIVWAAGPPEAVFRELSDLARLTRWSTRSPRRARPITDDGAGRRQRSFAVQRGQAAHASFDADHTGGNQTLVHQGRQQGLDAVGPADRQEGMGAFGGAPFDRDGAAAATGRVEAQPIVGFTFLPSLVVRRRRTATPPTIPSGSTQG